MITDIPVLVKLEMIGEAEINKQFTTIESMTHFVRGYLWAKLECEEDSD